MPAAVVLSSIASSDDDAAKRRCSLFVVPLWWCTKVTNTIKKLLATNQTKSVFGDSRWGMTPRGLVDALVHDDDDDDNGKTLMGNTKSSSSSLFCVDVGVWCDLPYVFCEETEYDPSHEDS